VLHLASTQPDRDARASELQSLLAAVDGAWSTDCPVPPFACRFELITAYPVMAFLVKGNLVRPALDVDRGYHLFGTITVPWSGRLQKSCRRSDNLGICSRVQLGDRDIRWLPPVHPYLIHISGTRAIPGLWPVLCGRCGLLASLFAKPYNAPV